MTSKSNSRTTAGFGSLFYDVSNFRNNKSYNIGKNKSSNIKDNKSSNPKKEKLSKRSPKGNIQNSDNDDSDNDDSQFDTGTTSI